MGLTRTGLSRLSVAEMLLSVVEANQYMNK